MEKQESRPFFEFGIKWINEKEVALVLGISVYTLRQHRHKGIGLPYVKYGKSVRYSSADIAAYLESRKINHSRV
jgi:predicted DNA-binding transcriptional regulator AlpA